MIDVFYDYSQHFLPNLLSAKSNTVKEQKMPNLHKEKKKSEDGKKKKEEREKCRL